MTAGLGEYPTTQGPVDLRDQFARVFEIETLAQVDADYFVTTNGALNALGHVFASNKIKRVLYPMPGFDVSIAARRSSKEARAVYWDIDDSIGDLLDVLDHSLDRRHGGDAIVVNFPANPSGVLPTEDEWMSLVNLASDANATLVIDDVYRFSGPTVARPATDADHVVVVDSLSKRLGLPGLRLGSVLARGPLLSDVRRSVAEASVGVSLVATEVATFGLSRYTQDPAIREGVRSELDRRRQLVRTALSPDLLAALVLADQGLYGCLKLESREEELAVNARLNERHVYLTPGTGLSHDRLGQPFLRFCLGATSDLSDAFEYINLAVAESRYGNPDRDL